MTNLLDILKEADLRIGFTQHFKSPATRETLDRETLQKRFLLCLYGLGTNTGLKRVSMGDHGQSYQELLYTRRRYLHQDQLRVAIVDIANATFQVRLPHIWGEGTTTCASDSTQFGAWNQNLMTEWHLRYGGKGVMIYWHVEKHATCIYSQLKTCSSQAFAELGRVVKTIFLCQYLQSEALRREINAGLNVIENWNGANSFIFYGKSGDFATNRLDEQELAALSLHLLQICLVYVNTLLIQQVLSEPRQLQQMKQEDLRALTPLIYSHVTPYGTFRLDLSERMLIEDAQSA